MVDDATPIDITQVLADQHAAVYRYAYRLTGSAADAEDLTQSVFLAAHEKIDQIRSIDSVRAWLFTILKNRFLKLQNKRQPTPAASIELNVNTIPATAPAELPIDREVLQKALNDLSVDARLVVMMFYYEGCSYREMAEKLDLPIGTVMSRLARAKTQLRSVLFPADSPAEAESPAKAESPLKGCSIMKTKRAVSKG